MEATVEITPKEIALLTNALSATLLVAEKSRSVNQGLFWQINNLQNAPEIVPVQFRELLEIIRAIPALEIFNNMQQLTLYYPKSIDFFFLVKWLVSRAQQTDTKTAINDLVNYLGLKEFEVHEILTFECRGFKVDTVFADEFQTSVKSWDKFPSTDTEWQIALYSFYGWSKPTSFISRTYSIKKMYTRSWDSQEYSPQSIDALLDILRCITLLTRTSTRFSYHFVEASESIPHLGHFIRFGVDNRSFPIPNLSMKELETTALEILYKRFNALDENRKLRYRIAIDRLNLSYLAGIRFVDTAIELGVAIEVIYVPTKASEGISALVRTRATRFLGGTTKEREQRNSLLKDVYNLRSLAVHAGRFDTKDSARKWQDSNNISTTLNAGQNLVADSIIRLIENGEPDWDEFDISN